MFKIAIVFGGDPFYPKGLYNAVINRALILNGLNEFKVDVFCLCNYDTQLTRILRKTPRPDTPKVPYIVNDNIKINLLWYPLSVIDNILSAKLHQSPFFYYQRLKKFARRLKGYDIISAHSLDGGLLASFASNKFGTPYTVTWHGSDIHTVPWVSKPARLKTIKITKSAKANFYVSQNLLDISDKILKTDNKYLAYNGVNPRFKKISDEEIKLEKAQRCINLHNKVVSFVGGLLDVKNVLLLPSIFSEIRERFGESIEFWIVGDGKLRGNIINEMQKRSHLNFKFWGDVDVNDMPKIMNCTDVLILPSKNEGLPLVTVEALSCETNVVSSNVGGCQEVIGPENVVNLGDNFVSNIASRTVEILKSKTPAPKLDAKFQWHSTVALEAKILKEVILSTK